MDATDERPIWERMEGEPSKWFVLFERYRMAGLSRSFQTVWESEGNQGPASGAFRRTAARWRWRERAAAWDESESLRQVAEWTVEQRRLRGVAARIAAIGLAKAAEAIEAARTEGMTLDDALEAGSKGYDLAERAIGGGVLAELEELTRRVCGGRDAGEEGD